jgi:tetratricopeptide (TPR) repeat protein
MVVSGKQIFAILGAILLTVGLYWMPLKASKPLVATEKQPALSTPENIYNFEAGLQKAKSKATATELKKISILEDQIKTGISDKNVLLNNLGKQWDLQQQPAIAAHYFEMMAFSQPSESNWLNPAYRYFDAFKLEQDPSIRAELVDKAIACYTKVTVLNPENLDAKTDLGICYTETAQPMKGIMLLRDVVKEKPGHENAQFNLGLLSMKSRQFEKAVERFEKVVQINARNMDAYLYLGQAYVQKGEKTKAITAFEKYSSLSTNADAKKQVNSYIEKLKNN